MTARCRHGGRGRGSGPSEPRSGASLSHGGSGWSRSWWLVTVMVVTVMPRRRPARRGGQPAPRRPVPGFRRRLTRWSESWTRTVRHSESFRPCGHGGRPSGSQSCGPQAAPAAGGKPEPGRLSPARPPRRPSGSVPVVGRTSANLTVPRRRRRHRRLRGARRLNPGPGEARGPRHCPAH